MNKQDIISHNETLAERRIRKAYINNGITDAMKLCQIYMGLDLRSAYSKTCGICFDLMSESEVSE